MKKELIIKEIKDYIIEQDDYFEDKDEYTILNEFIEYYNDNIKTKTLEFKKLDSKTLISYSQDEFNEEVKVYYVYEVSDGKETKLFGIFGTYDSYSGVELSDYGFVEKEPRVVYDYKIIKEEENKEENKEELKEKIKKALFEIEKIYIINYYNKRIKEEGLEEESEEESEVLEYKKELERISKKEYNYDIGLSNLEDIDFIQYIEYEDDNYKLTPQIYSKRSEGEYYDISELFIKEEDKKYLIKFKLIFDPYEGIKGVSIELVKEMPSIGKDFKKIITLEN